MCQSQFPTIYHEKILSISPTSTHKAVNFIFQSIDLLFSEKKNLPTGQDDIKILSRTHIQQQFKIKTLKSSR